MRARTPTRVKVAVAAGVVVVPVALVALATGSPVALVFPLVLVMAVVALIAPVVTRAQQWHPPELALPDEPVQLGAELTPVYRLRSRRPRDLPPAAVEARLRCVEQVTYRVGTDTRTASSEVALVVTTAEGRPTPAGFEARLRLEVPLTAGGPTLRLANNKILWTLTVQVSDPTGTLPADTLHFPIEVAPVVDAGLRVRAGHDRNGP